MRAALERLAGQLQLVAVSSVYESDPVDATPPNYLNAVCAADSIIGPEALLEYLLATEQLLGRIRSFRGAPRTIDLDLLVFGDCISSTPHLLLPHPRLCERAFVLIPLLEIAQDLRDPRTNCLFSDALPHAKGHIARIGPLA